MKTALQITEDLDLPLKNNSIEWNIYCYKKRRNNGQVFYDCYTINIDDLDIIYSDIVNNIVKTYLNEKKIYEYSPEMPRDGIGYFNLKNQNCILKTPLNVFNEGIQKSVPYSGKFAKYNGYVIEGRINNLPYVRLISTSSVIKYYKKSYFIFMNEFNKIEKPVFEIKNNSDCILFNDYCLFLTNHAESIFDLEKQYKAIAQRSLRFLKDNNLISNFGYFKEYASSYPRALKFDSFDNERIIDFKNRSISDRRSILQTYSINSNEDGEITISNEDEAERTLNFLCSKLLTDFNSDCYEASYIRKITLPSSQ